MANTRDETGKGGVVERGLGHLRDLHAGIGGLALAGSVFFPGAEILTLIGEYEIIDALAHEGLRRVIKGRPLAGRRLAPQAGR